MKFCEKLFTNYVDVAIGNIRFLGFSALFCVCMIIYLDIFVINDCRNVKTCILYYSNATQHIISYVLFK